MRITGGFRSPEAQAHFMQLFQRGMSTWPDHEELKVPTSFGLTAVHAAGRPGAIPLVLLHGMAATSASWGPFVKHWSAERRVYAVDTITDAGLSIQQVPITFPPLFASWLEQTLDMLGLTRVHLLGLSYGGWAALNQAVYAPDRLQSVIAVEPAASINGLPRGYLARTLPLLWRSSRRTQTRALTYLLGQAPRGLYGDIMYAALDDFAAGGFVFPQLLVDAQLARIRTSTMIVLGARSPISDVPRARTRLARHVPAAELRVIENCGHGVTIDAPERLASWVSDYVTTHDRIEPVHQPH